MGAPSRRHLPTASAAILWRPIPNISKSSPLGLDSKPIWFHSSIGRSLAVSSSSSTLASAVKPVGEPFLVLGLGEREHNIVLQLPCEILSFATVVRSSQ